ncbi:hypothetical protein [Arthrobacter oryzae]|uniref:hypothetical protein n=1 Tax=Arthrobacter oryzae TaxID=409290 RepID=UPI002787D2B5|nr:hypothetical protein [Arthrobacter oryzae]MDQ0078228.1 hypothetical protein [Arthrobacter oryzae]
MAKFATVSADSDKSLCDQVSQLIRHHAPSYINVQVVPLVVADQNSPTGSRIIYQTSITHP